MHGNNPRPKSSLRDFGAQRERTLGGTESLARNTATRITQLIVVFATLAASSETVSAGFIEMEDREEWFASVGVVTTIDFTGFQPGEFIADQYARLGIIFTDGNDSIFPSEGAFPNDGVGLDGNGDINVSFAEPQAWLAVDYPGAIQIQLFLNGELVFDGPGHFPKTAGNFLGIIGKQPFDAARIIDPLGEAEIDDLHFGIPSPGAL